NQRVPRAGIEHFRIPGQPDGVGPAVDIDVGHAVPVGHFDLGQHHRALVPAGQGHHVVGGDELFRAGAAPLGQTRRVFVQQLEGPAQHAAVGVDVVLHDLEAAGDLSALDDGTWRGLADQDTD